MLAAAGDFDFTRFGYLRTADYLDAIAPPETSESTRNLAAAIEEAKAEILEEQIQR
jgi:hypothetical protein